MDWVTGEACGGRRRSLEKAEVQIFPSWFVVRNTPKVILLVTKCPHTISLLLTRQKYPVHHWFKIANESKVYALFISL